MAHQLPGDVGHVLFTETLSPRLERPSCACPHRQHISGLLHQTLGGSALCKLAHQILLWAQGKLLTLRAVYLPGHLNQGAEILSRQVLRPGNRGSTPRWWSRFGGGELVFISGNDTLSPLVFPNASSSSWTGYHGAGMAEAASAPRNSEERAPYGSWTWWASSTVSMGYSCQEEPSLSGGGSILHPRLELWKLWVWPLRGQTL